MNASVAGDEDERRPRFIVRVGKLLARAERIEFLPSSRFVNLESGERKRETKGEIRATMTLLDG